MGETWRHTSHPDLQALRGRHSLSFLIPFSYSIRHPNYRLDRSEGLNFTRNQIYQRYYCDLGHSSIMTYRTQAWLLSVHVWTLYPVIQLLETSTVSFPVQPCTCISGHSRSSLIEVTLNFNVSLPMPIFAPSLYCSRAKMCDFSSQPHKLNN